MSVGVGMSRSMVMDMSGRMRMHMGLRVCLVLAVTRELPVNMVAMATLMGLGHSSS